MAEKHKSKYKAPKDLDKSKKLKTRKDLKDYTHDDKKGAMNPKSTGDKQTNVLRKTDKEVVDNGKYDIKYNDDDRLYKSLEDGEYDPKTAAKRLKKRQDKEEKEIKDVIKDKIENLTREGKERLVREYLRRTFVKRLIEAEEAEDVAADKPEEEAPATDTASATPATDTASATPSTDSAGATPSTDSAGAAPATDTTGATPATDTTGAASATSTPTATGSTSTPAATDTTTTDNTEKEKEEPQTPEEKAKVELAKQEIVTKDWTEILSSEEDPAKLIKTGFNPLADAMGNLSKDSLRLAKMLLIKQLMKIKPIKKEQ